MKKSEIKIGIFGLGYVGLPLALEFSKKYDVFAFDVNKERISSLKNGFDTTNEVNKQNLKKRKSLTFTSDFNNLANCNFYIITVPTPVKNNNEPDLSLIKSASSMVASIIKKNDIIVYESTVYPGLTEEYCAPIIERISNLSFNKDFYLGYSPERINPGDKNHKLTNIVKITSGSTESVANEVDAVYSSIIKAGTYKAPSIKVAEAAKVIENTQRDINIALINELAMLFNKLDIETNEVLDAAQTKWNFLPFKPGLVGGHCIGVDPYYLTYKAKQENFNPKMILSGRKINDNMSSFVSKVFKSKLKKMIKSKNPKILILGFTFKEDCPDIRNTKVYDLYKHLSKSYQNIDIHDQIADPNEARDVYNINLISKPKHHYYDAMILAVAHKQYKRMGLSNIKKYLKDEYVIYDLKNLFDKNKDKNIFKL